MGLSYFVFKCLKIIFISKYRRVGGFIILCLVFFLEKIMFFLMCNVIKILSLQHLITYL